MKHARVHAFTLAEVMIAMMASTIVLGALLFASMQLQRALYASERYASAQSDQRRLLDYLSRDLRRAIGIGTTTSQGGAGATRLAGSTVLVEKGLSLVLTLPGYYQSEVPTDATYDEALPVVSANNRVDYGSEAGHARGVRVMYRREYIEAEKGMCFVRYEGDTSTVIVRETEDLHLQVAVSGDGRQCTLDVSFTPANRPQARVASHDQLLMRNIRID